MGLGARYMALPGHSQTELISRRDVNIKMGRFGSRAGAGKPRSRERRGISHWRIDECCEAPREEHGDIRLLANGKELVKRRQVDLARPGSRKRRGISRWGIDECCGAPRVEHCDIPRLENGNEFVKIRQNENRSILYVNTYK